VSETASSLIAYGTYHDRSVALKVAKQAGDEWRAGEILHAFGGHGVVAVHAYSDGAALLERLIPGDSLARLSLDGHDDEATQVLAGVVAKMSARPGIHPAVTAEQLAEGFGRYQATKDTQIPAQLVSEAQRMCAWLCATQTQRRLLHGDLQHYNVLFDRRRGWVAIDPKGVLAEMEFELGAALRNPIERPGLFVDAATIARRVSCFVQRLPIDRHRVLAWAFGQAVLSAIWEIEDQLVLAAANASIELAETLRRILLDERIFLEEP